MTPTLALLLVHDLLLAKGGIALPQSHGLRACIDRHKGRLHSELTRARIRRKASCLEQLKRLVDEEAAAAGGEEGEVYRHPRWIRINALKSTLEEQLESTFRAFTRVFSMEELMTSSSTADSNGSSSSSSNRILLDAHVPNLVAIPPGHDMSKTEAYAAGKIIFQDKASCFPAYLLDVRSEDGDVVDACAAPGNKTTHLAAIVHAHTPAEFESMPQTIFAFEKDAQRAKTLEKMVRVAGAKNMVRIGLGQDFLQTDPMADTFKNVGALLLDPSCSGSGIVGRDAMPKLHLPQDHHPAPRSRAQSQTGTQGAAATAAAAKEDHAPSRSSKRRKLEQTTDQNHHSVLLDDDGNEAVLLKTQEELQQRLEALSSFQLALLLHAFRFSGARKITYSTCSVHAQENEHVVTAALRSDTARERGWRILRRDEQVSGMKAWPVRGLAEACAGDKDAAIVADGCIRAHKDDGRGVMGFFVAGFVRDVSLAGTEDEEEGDEGPYVRDENGGIVRDVLGMPTLKATGHPVALVPREDRAADAAGVSESTEEEDEKDDDSEWGGFDD